MCRGWGYSVGYYCLLGSEPGRASGLLAHWTAVPLGTWVLIRCLDVLLFKSLIQHFSHLGNSFCGEFSASHDTSCHVSHAAAVVGTKPLLVLKASVHRMSCVWVQLLWGVGAETLSYTSCVGVELLWGAWQQRHCRTRGTCAPVQGTKGGPPGELAQLSISGSEPLGSTRQIIGGGVCECDAASVCLWRCCAVCACSGIAYGEAPLARLSLLGTIAAL